MADGQFPRKLILENLDESSTRILAPPALPRGTRH
jgi:hypothetical protein